MARVKWSKDLVVARIQERAANRLPINGTAVIKSDKKLYRAAMQHFGKDGWAKARTLAGFSPQDPRQHKWSKEKVVRAIIERHKKKLKLNSGYMHLQSETRRLYFAGYSYFGSWKSAVKAAGINYDSIYIKYEDRALYRKWTKERVVEKILHYQMRGVRLNNRSIRKTDATLLQAGMRYFGSWENAITAAGIPYNTVYLRMEDRCIKRTWTKERVLQAIQERSRKKLEMNYRSVAQSDEALIGGATRCFGSWAAALTEAGLDYEKIRKKKPSMWTKPLIISAIQARYAKGLSMTGLATRNDDPSLYNAAELHYGSRGWSKARVAAGLPPYDPPSWKKWNPMNVVAEIQALYRAGVALNTGAMASQPELERLRTAGRKVFGSWAKAVKTAGIKYSAVCLKRPRGWWTKKRILRLIKKLEKKGIRLASRSIRLVNSSLYAEAVRHFGGWGNAVEAAGISYRQHLRIWSTKAWLRRMQEDEYQSTLERARLNARRRALKLKGSR